MDNVTASPPGCWWKAECGAKSWRTQLCCCRCPGGVSVPGGQWRGHPHHGLSRQDPKAALIGCIAKGNRCTETSREKLYPPASMAVPGCSLTHGICCWWSCRAPGCCPTGAGGAGLVARVVWERGGRRAWLMGTSARPWPSSGGMEQYPEPGEGWKWCGSCSPGRYWHPRWVVGWTLITAVCRLLCGGDIPLLTCYLG